MKELFSLFAIFVTLFLFGMVVIRAGLFNIGKRQIHFFLSTCTNTTWKSFLVGLIATSLVQSSSAVLVLTVGLVATKLIPFRHTIGIILGANIGTTVTTQLLTLPLSTFIIPFLVIGLFCLLLSNSTAYGIGCLSLGLACIFIAMDGLEQLAQPLTSIPFFHSFIHTTNEIPIIGIMLGIAMTSIIQSSTATIAITMGLMNDEIISLVVGIAVMLGANIGTCITAFLASIGAGKEAKLVAYANIWLNLFGVLLFLPFIDLFATFVSELTPIPMVQLAHASFLFNAICSFLLLPLVTPFTRFIELIYREPRT